MRRAFSYWGMAAALMLAFCGCSGDGSSSGGNSTAPEQSTNSTTKADPLAGKTLQFTVTMSVNFSEPVGAVYTIDFHTDQTYTFHPSPQNREGQNPENGSYTFDATTGMIHFTRPDHQDIDGQLNFTSPTTGTARLMGSEGEVEEANFEQIAGPMQPANFHITPLTE